MNSITQKVDSWQDKSQYGPTKKKGKGQLQAWLAQLGRRWCFRGTHAYHASGTHGPFSPFRYLPTIFFLPSIPSFEGVLFAFTSLFFPVLLLSSPPSFPSVPFSFLFPFLPFFPLSLPFTLPYWHVSLTLSLFLLPLLPLSFSLLCPFLLSPLLYFPFPKENGFTREALGVCTEERETLRSRSVPAERQTDVTSLSDKAQPNTPAVARHN